MILVSEFMPRVVAETVVNEAYVHDQAYLAIADEDLERA